MSGQKIEQVRAALKHVLNNLRPGDLFNIIAYDDHIEAFKPELQRFNEETRKAALGFVEGIYAGGTTNIDGAMQVALAQLQDPNRPSYIVFLTDGLPTAGETNEMKIVANARHSTSSMRGSSPSASATTSTAGSWTSWSARTTARANTSAPTRTSKTAWPSSTAASSRP